MEEISDDMLRQGDMFVARFLRSQKGFEILLKKGWVEEKMQYMLNIGNNYYTQLVE